MAPKVIVADEIGSKEDVKAIRIAMCSGVKGIFTAHGSNLEDIKLNPNIKELIENNCFEKIIFLSDKKAKGEVERCIGDVS
jgi:stage III sporulation protein AA